jgi:cell wall-associated NlpC family hydrolase
MKRISLAAIFLLTAFNVSSSQAKSRSRPLPTAHRSRARTTSRALTAPRNVGRLGQVVRNDSPIYSSPGKKPLYSIIPTDTYLVLVGQRDDWYAVLMADGRYGWIAKSRVSLLNYDVVSGKTGNAGVDFGNKVVQDAFKYLGLPYVWGGYSTSGTDCSGFIKAVFAQNGISLPRVARDQAKVGKDVPTSELRPGDRVYFCFKGQYIDHTGMYIGNGYFIHNSISNGRVAVDLLTSHKYWSHLVSCRR